MSRATSLASALVVVLVTLLAVFATKAVAVDSDPAPAGNPELDAGRKAIEARDWNSAIRSLSAAERREPRNADVQNLLGYAYRNSGKLDVAFKHYDRALKLDPGHRGAHEYIGEAWLMANDPVRAEQHLAALKKLCPRDCAEHDDLAKSIAEYRRRAAAAGKK